jgi:hypothetical protein
VRVAHGQDQVGVVQHSGCRRSRWRGSWA